jgi:CRISPR-associated protein Cmr2
MPKQHLALVLSPITETISRARKTRELWASSFVFSRMMYQLLAHRPASTTRIAPAFSAQKEHAYGAGIYHDRCILSVEEGTEVDIGKWLVEAREALADEMGTTAATIQRLVKIEVLRASWSVAELAAATKEHDTIAIHRLNRLLDNLELRPVYIPREDKQNLVTLLDSRIQQLYELGFSKGTSVFLPMPNATVGRLPSLPEIGLRELNNHPEASVRKAYQNLVQQPFNDRVTLLSTVGGRGKDLKAKLDQLKAKGGLPDDFLEDSQLFNEAFFEYLKRAFAADENLKDSIIRFRHKYVAVVQLDGDGLGKAITKISATDADGSRFRRFSERLLSYADAAVKMVIDYGGLPVYAGGDDLLFLAPVAMRHNEEATNVLSLCARLDDLFQKEMDDESLSLSGGVFVSYYKFPLGEAVAAAGKLEKRAKKFAIYREQDKLNDPKKEWEPHRKKQAITLEVRKHSGQSFGATFHLRAQSFPLLEKILAFDTDLEDSFLTAAMHRLQSIPTLLADVARHGDDNRRAAFREHQFGKGGPKHEGQYLTDVLEYAQAVFEAYDDALPEKRLEPIREALEKEQRAVSPLDYELTQRIFAALRFKQFLIMPDHD